MTSTLSALAGVATSGRGPGRPRVQEHDERILAATLDLIDRGRPVTMAAIVEGSGIGRAAIYRRWPSLTDLIATALDVGRVKDPIPVEAADPDSFLTALLGGASDVKRTYPERRFRRRLQLVLEDRALQRKYWDSHVARRRVSMAAALQAGIGAGTMRADLDVEAACDLIAGVFYYQVVARGESLEDPGVIARCREAVTIALRGMSA